MLCIVSLVYLGGRGDLLVEEGEQADTVLDQAPSKPTADNRRVGSGTERQTWEHRLKAIEPSLGSSHVSSFERLVEVQSDS